MWGISTLKRKSDTNSFYVNVRLTLTLTLTYHDMSIISSQVKTKRQAHPPPIEAEGVFIQKNFFAKNCGIKIFAK
jgi:hypothetical protein